MSAIQEHPAPAAAPVTPGSKEDVRAYWNSHSCGEASAVGEDARAKFENQAKVRYEVEPYIHDFARFHEGAGKDILEVGVGMGADHLEWAKSKPKSLRGVDLTPRAAAFTTERLKTYGFTPQVQVGDAENLPFPDASFDLVYSWGVIMCSPDTPRAFREIHRVLRPGGTARIMIYHKHSLVGWGLWLRYGLFAGKPWRSLADIYAHHLESPGTKCYNMKETRAMCTMFSKVELSRHQAFADLLIGEVGQNHKGPLLTIAKAVWPRWFIKRFCKGIGALIFIEAVK